MLFQASGREGYSLLRAEKEALLTTLSAAAGHPGCGGGLPTRARAAERDAWQERL